MRPLRRRRRPGMPQRIASPSLSELALFIIVALTTLPRHATAHTAPARLSLVQPPATALDPNITLSVGPTLLFSSGEWVTVTWTGIESWMFPDAFVAAFSPGMILDDPARITTVAPIKYQFLTAEEPFTEDFTGGVLEEGEEALNGGGLEGGRVNGGGFRGGGVNQKALEREAVNRKGETPLKSEGVESDVAAGGGVAGEGAGVGEAVESLRFRLLNLRDVEGYRFGLFKGGVENPVLVAKTTDPVKFARPYEVLQLHLALTSEADAMRVSWVTGHASQAPTVRFREAVFEDSQPGETPPARWQETAAESSLSYSRTDMCGAPATTKGFHNPGLLHSAVLTSLVPGKPYEYKAGDVDGDEWGAPAFFFAPPASSLSSSSSSSSATSSSSPVAPPPVLQSLERLGSSDGTTKPTSTAAGPKDSSGTKASNNGTKASNSGTKAGNSGTKASNSGTKASNSGNSVNNRAKDEDEVEGGRAKATASVDSEAWGPEAVKIAIFGDMGTAEVDGTLDAGHTNEPPSIRTVGILKEQLGAGAQSVGGGAGGESGQAENAAPEPQLGLVLHIGDLSYARGYDAQWDEYMDQIQPVASRVPWMVGVGNHERDFPTASKSPTRPDLSYFTGDDSGGDCGVPTAFRFLMPGGASEAMADSPWYSFEFGPVHFTVISTEHDFTTGSEQHAFVQGDLSSVDRAKTPWLVFAGHRPMYVNSGGEGAGDCKGAAAEEEHCSNDQPVAKLLRESFEDLFVEHQVDLAVYGHHHSYQRTCKVVGEVCKGFSSQGTAVDEAQGYVAPVHVVLGMAGMGLSQNMVSPRPEWVEYSTDREFGLGLLVADRSKLKLSFILDTDGQMADEMMLTRPPSEDVAPVGQTSGGGLTFSHDRSTGLSASRRSQDDEQHLRQKKEKAERIGAGRARQAKRVT